MAEDPITGVKAPLLLNGRSGETYCIGTPSGALPSNFHIVVIPGNPGMVDFYIQFMKHISNKFKGSVPISAISHAGHTNWLGYGQEERLADTGIYSLEEQIEHKVDYLSMLEEKHSAEQAKNCLTPTPLQFILVGHSVGSFICLRLRLMQRFRIAQVINLFPTFQYLYEGLTPTIQWMIMPGLRHVASMATGLVPLSWKRYLVRAYSTGLSEEAQDVVASGFNRYAVLHNVLYMARTEAQDIRELNPDLIQPLDSTYFLYGPTDHYTPREQVEHFRMTYPEAKVTIAGEECVHAFCVSSEQSVIVADQVCSFIDEQCDMSGSL